MGIKMVMAAIKLFLIFFFIPPGFFICASITGAETAPGQPAATVAAVRGQAEAAGKTGQWRSLSVKSPVYESDTVKTGEQGRIQLLFSDNTLYALGSNAEMKIAAYHWREKDGKGTLKSRVNEGAFRVMGGAITRSSPQQFTTETPLATIGVRGSMYAGIVTPSSLEVLFQGGKGIEVFNDLGRVQIDRPDFGTRVELDKPPETPRRFSGQEIKNLRKKLAGNQGEPREKKKEKAVGPGKTPVRRQAGLPERKSRVERDLEIPPPNEFKPVVDTTEPLPEIIPDSLYRYSGKITGSSLNRDGSADTISDSIMMEVNWHDQKILARIENEDGPPIFAIGDLNGRQITSFRVIGSDLDSEPIPDFPDSPPPPDNEDIDHGRVVAISGRGQGEIIGNDYENFNIEASGKGLSIRNYPEPVFTWEFKGSGSLLSTQDLEPGGESALWQGFVSSVAENMEDPHKERRYFLNKEPEDFQLAVNGEKGTVQGGFSAGDATGSGIRLDNILVGGSLGSSFISDRSFAAVLGCPGEDCVESGQECGGLREQAGFLISAGPDSERKIAAYTTWGYWEAAYQDPVADVTY
ncbi:MAG: FecR domain-containing protein, partial [Desulfobia sp.]